MSIISNILEEIIFDVYILSSDKGEKDKEKKFFYITSKSTGVTPYYAEKMHNDNIKIEKMKRIYIWDIRKFINDKDPILIDMHKMFIPFFEKNNDEVENEKEIFLIPYRVGQKLNIEKEIKLSNKNFLKRVRKFNYDIFSNYYQDHNILKFFYEKMLIPHIKNRYGKSARIDSFHQLENIFKNGELLMIKLDDKYVAGELYEIIGDNLFLRMQGVFDESFVKEGALVAAYYFSILRAKEINAKIVDFGGSKPFLLDGVLRHKNTWGTKIYEDRTAKRVIYLRNISFKEPFIYLKENSLRIGIFSEDDKLIKEYAGSGLDFEVIKNHN